MADTKAGFKAGERLLHAFLGDVVYSDAAAALQRLNPDPTSLFVEHDGEVKEVTAHLVRRPAEARPDHWPIDVEEHLGVKKGGFSLLAHGAAVDEGDFAAGWRCLHCLEAGRPSGVFPNDPLGLWLHVQNQHPDIPVPEPKEA